MIHGLSRTTIWLVIFVTFMVFVPAFAAEPLRRGKPERQPWSAAAPAEQSTSEATPREAALAILERASRPFVPYVAASGKTLTVVVELSAASIKAGRWKDGADVVIRAVDSEGEPLATGKGRIEAGDYSIAIPLRLRDAWPARVTFAVRAAGERPADDWIKLEPPPPGGALVGEPIAFRSGSRIAQRPVAGFAFARNERLRVEWPVLAPIERREVRLLDRSGKPIQVELPLDAEPAMTKIVLDMSLSGLPRGDYLLELATGSGVRIDRKLLAIRIKP